MTKEIKLTKGKVALVDDEDFERINRHKWYACKDRLTWYARRDTIFGNVLMHRDIMELPNNVLVDHKNNNGLDNRKENLRPASTSQNKANRGMQKNNHSGYKGIRPSKNKWAAQIQCNHKWEHLGVFNTPEEAARAYDKRAVELFGEFAKTNFPTG